MRWLARPLAMTAMWLTATGFFGMAYFLSGRSIRVEEAIIFAVAFGTAAAVSAVIALAIGAKRRWAIEAAVPIAILMAAPVGTAGALTWLAPTMSKNLQAAGYFSQYRGSFPQQLAPPRGLSSGPSWRVGLHGSEAKADVWPRMTAPDQRSPSLKNNSARCRVST
jgi:hypothetical protein